jgi:histone acetyltransferase MYST1
MKAQILLFRDSGSLAYVHFTGQDKRFDAWLPTTDLHPLPPESPPPGDSRVLTRQARRHQDSLDEFLTSEAQQFERLHQGVTKIRNVEKITIGSHIIRAWYYSPYPRPFHACSHLFICEFCFHYFDKAEDLSAHRTSGENHPPGREIYRKDTLSIFEMYGTRQKFCCQCLCLFGKLFLGDKAFFYAVEGLVFYVLCECDSKGAHSVGYFSRVIMSEENNILSRIVIFPPFQRQGYSRVLISLSYEIAKRQRTSGGPERPLSDFGSFAFRSYWKEVLIEVLHEQGNKIDSLQNLERFTAIQSADLIEVLKELQCVMKVRGEYKLKINRKVLSVAIEQLKGKKRQPLIDRTRLIWFPDSEE